MLAAVSRGLPHLPLVQVMDHPHPLVGLHQLLWEVGCQLHVLGAQAHLQNTQSAGKFWLR